MKNIVCEGKRSKWGNLVIGSWDKERGLLWFRFWCKHIPGHEGEAMPVFSTDPFDALQFVYQDMAEKTKDRIDKMFPGSYTYFVAPAALAHSKGGQNFLKFIYSPDPEDETDGDEDPVETSATFTASRSEDT